MKTEIVTFKIDEQVVSIRLQELSVDKAMELLSPRMNIFNQDGRVDDILAFAKYAIENETRFVWEEGETPTVLDYKNKFGTKGWRLLMNTIELFALTGEIMADGEFIFKGGADRVASQKSRDD